MVNILVYSWVKVFVKSSISDDISLLISRTSRKDHSVPVTVLSQSHSRLIRYAEFAPGAAVKGYTLNPGT